MEDREKDEEVVEHSIGCSLMTFLVILVVVGMIMWKCEFSYKNIPTGYEFKVEIKR